MAAEGEPNIEIRALIALVISLAILAGWQYFFAPPAPPPVPPAAEQSQGEGTVGEPESMAPTPEAAEALGETPTPIISISIQNDIGSPETLFVGNQFGQFRGIAAGGVQVISVCDLSLVYVHSAAGNATYNWMAGE